MSGIAVGPMVFLMGIGQAQPADVGDVRPPSAGGFTALPAGLRFDQASELVLDHLVLTLPMGLWAVTRYDGERQVFLVVRDRVYGVPPGTAVNWSDTFCQHMVTGVGPQFAPDLDRVPVYSGLPARRAFEIRCYVGVPILRSDGKLFGTLCAYDPKVQDQQIVQYQPLLQVFCTLLGGILELDQLRASTERDLERSYLEAETDALTGLLNRSGWDRRLLLEEERYRRFGDPGTVVVIDLGRAETIHGPAEPASEDHVLRAARALRQVMRRGDLLARTGGEELGLLAAGVSAGQASHLVTRMRATLEKTGLRAAFGHAPFTASGGLAGAWQAAGEAIAVQLAARAPG